MNEIEAHLRDEFAGKALQGLLAGPCSRVTSVGVLDDVDAQLMANDAYIIADAMLKARRKPIE